MFTSPILTSLQNSNCKNVLVAGCGGGYDVYSGIPFYVALKEQGFNVILANLAFTMLESLTEDESTKSIPVDLNHTASRRARPAGWEVHSKSNNQSLEYFPERYLCEYLDRKHGVSNTVVYTFDRSNGVETLRQCYEYLIQKESIDAVILVDGGTDSIMRGDEEGLGSPHEDCLSISAVYKIDRTVLPMENRFLVCIGFGVDCFHGVSHDHFLENTSTIIDKYENGFLGTFSLLREMTEYKVYREACDHTFKKMKQSPSIVSSSVLSAVEGKFGNYHALPQRTRSSKLYINPLMSIFWCYRVEPVFLESTYMSKLLNTRSMSELTSELNKYRSSLKTVRKAKTLPV